MYLGMFVQLEHPICSCPEEHQRVRLASSSTPPQVTISCNKCQARFTVPRGEIEIEIVTDRRTQTREETGTGGRLGLLTEDQ